MKNKLQNSKSLFIVVIFYVFMQLISWPPLRYWGWWGGGNFLDTWQILQNAHCYESIGLRVYELSNGCAWLYPYGRPLLQFLNTFHLFENDARYIGFLFLFLLAVVVSSIQVLVRTEKGGINYFLPFLIISPPMLLLAERGNFDILMLTIIFFSSYFFYKKRYFLSVLLVFTSALIKFYTFPLLLIYLFIPKAIKLRVFTFLLIILSFLSIYRDISTTEYTYQGGPKVVFGSELVFSHLGQFSSLYFLFEQRKILGIVLSLMQIGIVYSLSQRKKITLIVAENIKSLNVILYTFLSTTSFFCYFLGISTDYRMVFTLLSSALLVPMLAKGNAMQQVVVSLTLISAWLSFPSGGLEILGDITLGVLTCIHIVFFFLNRKRFYNIHL
jgi:hypothetical protein